jgi:iron complex outermembrane receptor protein
MKKYIIGLLGLIANYSNIQAQILFSDSQTILLVNIETTASGIESNFNVILNKEISTSHQILSENLEKIPGVQSYSMGPGNGKTAIRGLSGNRIGVYVDGLRLDNQQWQDEHGLGFIAFDNDQQRVFFGPSNTIAGNEAMGGMVSIVQTMPTRLGTFQSLTTGFTTNDLGFTAKYEREVKNAKSSHWFNAYYGTHGDYLNGQYQPILNSRFDLMQLKFGSEKTLKNNNLLMLNYRLSVSQTGIARISDSLELVQIKNGDSREFEGPNHVVALQCFSAKLNKDHKNGKSEFIAGIMSNTRIELEESKMKGLAMQLNTAQLRHSRYFINGSWKFEFAENLMAQTNRNFGNSIVVPNMNMFSGGITGLVKKTIHSFALNLQVGLTEQLLASKNLSNKFYFAPNVALNGVQSISKNYEIGFRLSKSYRAPNIHELFANGLSEDAYRFDIGYSNFKEESLSQIDINFIGKGNYQQLQFAIFTGQLNNYISLNSTDKFILKAPVYEYRSDKGSMLGGELSHSIFNSQKTILLQNSLNYTHIKSGSRNIAFAPPLKCKMNLIYTIRNKNQLLNDLKLNFEYIYIKVIQPYFEIDKTNQSYSVLNFYLTKNFKKSDISFYIKNYLSSNYIDPMSMLKTVPYTAPGMNLGIFYKYNF